jgi:hypothetical protein
MSAQWKFFTRGSTLASGMRGVPAMIRWTPRSWSSGETSHTQGIAKQTR